MGLIKDFFFPPPPGEPDPIDDALRILSSFDYFTPGVGLLMDMAADVNYVMHTMECDMSEVQLHKKRLRELGYKVNPAQPSGRRNAVLVYYLPVRQEVIQEAYEKNAISRRDRDRFLRMIHRGEI